MSDSPTATEQARLETLEALTRQALAAASAASAVIASPNYVTAVNSASVGPSNPLTFSAPAITRKTSGVFHVTCTSCPFPNGAPVVFTFTMYRDAVQLPPIKKTLPAGPGDDYPVCLDWIDVVTDHSPHVYSFQASAPGGTISDSAEHCTITVVEE